MSSDTQRAALERNLTLYPWYAVAQSTYFWMPVFFLYLSSRVGLREVLWLEAIYYVAVFVAEVPTGYLSDRVGRRATMLASAVCLCLSYTLFAVAGGFTTLALAEVLLALGFALNSGTDTSFHFDALAACDRVEEYGDREARLSRLAFWTQGLGALGGGAIALLDLRLAYVLSAVSAALALLVALRFVEPPHAQGAARAARRFRHQLAACLRITATRPLAWLFLLGVAATVVNHIPYEFYQSYIALALTGESLAAATPLVTGVHVTVASAIAGLVGAWSMRLQRRVGTRQVLLLGFAFQVALVTLMGLVLSPVVAVLLTLRSVPRALQQAPLRAAVAPRLDSSMRATWLSLESLTGRLGYGLTLLALSASAAGAADWPALSSLLFEATIVAVVLLLVLALTRPLGAEAPR